MLTIFLGFILLGLVIAGMAIGVIMGRRPITGSCGGIGAALGEKNYTCDICGDDPAKCDEIQSAEQGPTKSLAYDATKKGK
ncbi:putative exported protein [gamma proteobacterium IMCC1989]|nr:putative exported protein [gamma proteobacterium IMCC1989]